MENITIIDDFLDNDTLNIMLNYINEFTYKFGHTSGNRERDITIFFSYFIENIFFSEYIKHKIELVTNKKFILDRTYLHIQTFGLNGCYHIDTPNPNTYTFCIYITPRSNNEIDEIGGDFYIKIPNSKIILSILPYMNRGIIFPSTYLHKGMAYNQYSLDGRICVTWKLTEII